MNLFPAKNEHQMPVEVKRRLTAAIVFSLAVHAVVLSLQFGVPGMGLPDLNTPKLEHSAAPPLATGITLTINDVVSAPVSPVKPVVAPPPRVAPVPPQKNVEPAMVPRGIQLIAPPSITPVVQPSEKKEHNQQVNKQLALAKRKSATATKSNRPHKVIVSEIPDLITQDIVRDGSFVVAVRDPDEVKKEDVVQDLMPKVAEPVAVPVEAKTEIPIEPEVKIAAPVADPEAAVASVARFDIDQSKQQKREADNLLRTQDLLIATKQDNTAKDRILKQLDEENHRQAEQIQRQQAAEQAAALKRHAEAELQLQTQLQEQDQYLKVQHETVTAATLAQTEKQRAETMRQVDEALKQQLQAESVQRELLRKERLRESALARQQKEELEERTLQEAEMQRQLQARQQAAVAAQAAQIASQNALVQSDVSGKSSRASARTNGDDIFDSGNAHTGTDTGTGNKSGAFVLPKSLLSSDLANRARESAQGLGLLQGKPPLPVVDEKARRHAIFNNTERDVQLRMYADSWKQKIERNGNLNYSQTSSNKSRGDPLVSVSIRSDGSVEQVTILRSSGRDDIDQAVRNIVRINARYAAFPPNIAAQYDVLEIRRIWSFDDNLRIIEEIR